MPEPADASKLGAAPERFPVKIWLIAFAGWAFDFYDLVLFSFLLIPIGHDMGLSATQEAWLLGVALGASGLGGILFGYCPTCTAARASWSGRSASTRWAPP